MGQSPRPRDRPRKSGPREPNGQLQRRDRPELAARRRMLAVLVAHQNARCALCGTRGEPLVLDHDHATGAVRGALCPYCNGAEGLNSGDAATLAAYRAHPPASGWGWIYPR